MYCVTMHESGDYDPQKMHNSTSFFLYCNNNTVKCSKSGEVVHLLAAVIDQVRSGPGIRRYQVHSIITVF